MIPYERQKEIIDYLSNKEIVKFDELQQDFSNVSGSTLRRDLKKLEVDGKIKHLSGGAFTMTSPTGELSIARKTSLNSKKKKIIAQLAAEQISVGDSVYVDSGSNNALLLNEIIDQKITIYTTNTKVLNINNEVQADIILLGGYYNPVISSLSGSLTRNNLKNLYFDCAFLGANGIDENKGVTTPNINEAEKKRIVKNNSQKTYLLCDSSKFHRISTVHVFDLADVTLISDKKDQSLSQYVPFIVPKN